VIRLSPGQDASSAVPHAGTRSRTDAANIGPALVTTRREESAMTNPDHSTPDPYHAKVQPGAPTGTHGSFDSGIKPGLSRFDRIDRQIRWLKVLLALNIALNLVILLKL
jgi:hypothetical protein